MDDDLNRHARTMWLGLLIGKLQDGFCGIVRWPTILVLGKRNWRILDFNVYELKMENIQQQYLGDDWAARLEIVLNDYQLIDFKMWAIVGYRQTALNRTDRHCHISRDQLLSGQKVPCSGLALVVGPLTIESMLFLFLIGIPHGGVAHQSPIDRWRL